MRTSFWVTAVAAVLLPAAAAASPGSTGGIAQGSPLALPLVSLTSTAPAATSLAPASVELTNPFVGAIRYRPRAYRGRGYVVPTTTQIHAGFFDPTHNFSTGFDGGFRIGPQLDPNVQVGLAVDWWHKSQSETMDLGTVEFPGGGSAVEQIQLSRSSADLLPILAFVQVSGDENLPVVPYVGVGAGYEWLFLNADFPDGSSFDQTFGGFGWQVWGGAGIPLNGRTRVNGEVFYNGSDVGSDVDVFFPGIGPATVHDVVKMDGVGMRFGLSWGF